MNNKKEIELLMSLGADYKIWSKLKHIHSKSKIVSTFAEHSLLDEFVYFCMRSKDIYNSCLTMGKKN